MSPTMKLWEGNGTIIMGQDHYQGKSVVYDGGRSVGVLCHKRVPMKAYE